MTTNERKPTPSGSAQAEPDKNQRKKYIAILTFTQYSRATVIIEANTLEEAEEKAEEIFPDEVEDWNLVNGEVSVESVEPVTERRNHE